MNDDFYPVADTY